jgi:hypothetical protein
VHADRAAELSEVAGEKREKPLPHGAKLGHPRYAGRAKGTKNKATIERELIAAEIAKRQMTRAQEHGRELAVEVLERFMKIFEGAARVHRPVTDEEVKAGKDPNPMGDWEKFRSWARDCVDCAKALAQYQSPRFSAIAIAPTPQIDESARIRRFSLTIFEGGRALPKPREDVA